VREPSVSPAMGQGWLPLRQPILSRTSSIILVTVTGLVLVFVPVCALLTPPSSPFYLSTYVMTLLGKILCFATAAVALDLVWGYCGILSLGHGLYFALGGYMIGMYLMRSIGLDGVYHSPLPDFMVFLDWKSLPWFWRGTEHFLYALFLVMFVPGALAWIFGFFAFRSGVKGVYLSIITQAMTFAAMLLFYRNETGFGGNNGFTDFKRILGFPITAVGTRTALLLASFLLLVLTFLAGRMIVTSKFGRVVRAIRDTEPRIVFLGYNPVGYKLALWTFSAIVCALAGALYVPQVGIINPGEMSPASSIEIAIWVALGGRGTLIGPVLGAFLVNGAKSYLTVAFSGYWLFFLGLLFVIVPIWLPRGFIGLLQFRRKRSIDLPAAALEPTKK
jgi:urea transport system permease protein